MGMIARSISCLFAILVVAVAAGAQTRRPPVSGDDTGRDAVGFRKDSVTKETVGDRRAPANTPTTKQAIEDFMQIQKINRQIQDISKQEPLALKDIAAAAKDVNTRAKRLKTSLTLPSPSKEALGDGIASPTSTGEFLKLVKELDTNIRAFVTNPIFRQINDTSRDLLMEAGVSLSKVLTLSKILEQSSSKLPQ